MAKVLISDKISESAIQIFKNNKIEVDYKPGISEDELNSIIHDYDEINQEPGLHTQYYWPSVTPEVFIEHNGSLVYRGMIDNSYQSLGQWTYPSENYLMDILNEIVAGAEITYTETQAVGCLINY